jgi:hypothetical protein
MKKDNEVGSFEITEYGVEHEIPARILGVLQEIIRDQNKNFPSYQFSVRFTGNKMRLVYVSYEFNYPGRKKDIDEMAKRLLNETVKNLKKEFKSRVHEALDIVEDKSMADFAVHKVSLNERYMYTSWRVFEVKNFEVVTEE